MTASAAEGISTRSVLLMSKSKAERKRHLDRINQRKCRQRRQVRIDELEGELEETADMLRGAEKENEYLREQLKAMRTSLQNLLGDIPMLDQKEDSIVVTVSEHSQRQQSSSSPWNFEDEPTRALSNGHDGTNGAYIHPVSGRPTPESDEVPARATTAEREIVQVLSAPPIPTSITIQAQILSITDEASGFTFGLPSLGQDTADAISDVPQLTITDIGLTDFSFSINQDIIMSNFDPLADAPWAGTIEHTLNKASASSSLHAIDPSSPWPAWATPLQHTAPICQCDILIHRMIHCLTDGQSRLSPASEQKSFPSVTSLLNPTAEAPTSPLLAPSKAITTTVLPSVPSGTTTPFPMGGTFTSLYPAPPHSLGTGTWLALPNLPERMAALHNIARLARWQSQPTQRNWDALPPALHPTDMQRRTPHPSWVDTLMWPAAREAIIARGDYTDLTDRLLTTFVPAFSVNWTRPVSEMFAEGGSGVGEVVLGREFLEHIWDAGNWTCNSDFTGELAFLRGTMRTSVAGK